MHNVQPFRTKTYVAPPFAGAHKVEGFAAKPEAVATPNAHKEHVRSIISAVDPTEVCLVPKGNWGIRPAPKADKTRVDARDDIGGEDVKSEIAKGGQKCTTNCSHI